MVTIMITIMLTVTVKITITIMVTVTLMIMVMIRIMITITITIMHLYSALSLKGSNALYNEIQGAEDILDVRLCFHSLLFKTVIILWL